jgi:4-amino-4-deoxy-L-arabinose transferase-like glycosyltransferase
MNLAASSKRDRRQLRLSQITVPLLLAVLLLSFGLRIYRLGDKSVWWDEGLAAWAARQSLWDSARWTAADVHPPLYFWMLHFWRLGSGDSEFGLRVLSVAVGVLTVAATYKLGQAVSDAPTGLLAALLIGISRFDIWWSQEMRMYAMTALLAALSLWAAIRFWDRGRLADGLAYVLFASAGLYTLYLQASVLVVVNLVWLWVWVRARDRWRELLRWGTAQAAALVLFAPWLFYALGRIPTWSSASPIKPGIFLRIYWTVLTTGIPVNVERYAWLTVPVLAVFLTGLAALGGYARHEWRVGRNVTLFLLGLLLPAGVVYLVSLPRERFFYSPQLAPRYLIVFAPAFYTLLAWGTARLGRHRRWAVGVAMSVIAIASAYGLWTYYPERILVDDYKSLTSTLRAYQQAGDAVVLYTDRDWPVFVYHYTGPWHKVPYALQMTPQAAEDYMSAVWESHDGIWLVVTPYAAVSDPQGAVPAWLQERALAVAEHRFADKVLRFYARTPQRAQTASALSPDAAPPVALQALFQNGARLIGYGQAVQAYRNGDTIHLFLYWEGGQADIDGQVCLVQDDRKRREVEKCVDMTIPGTAQGQRSRRQVDLAVPPDAAGGRYMFTVQSLTEESQEVWFGHISLRPLRQHTLTASDVTIPHRAETDFGDGVRLLGYDLQLQSIKAGDTLYLTLYWEARQPVEHRYKVFTHVLGDVFHAERDSFIWGQQDNEPANGTQPTSTWRPGRVVEDPYAIPLDPSAPPGQYAIEIGLYDPATIERLPVLDAQGQIIADHLILTHIDVTDR